LDIYKTYIGRGSSNVPVNLGYPVNSSFDDFGIIFNAGRAKGFFSSNRLGTDDIYVFENAPFIIQLQGTVLSRTTLQRLDQAKVVLWSTDEDRPAIDSFFTDLTGNFHFPIRPGQRYTLQFSRNGYVEDSILITNTGIQSMLVLQPALLTPLRSTPPVVIVKGRTDIQAKINELAKMVFFDRDKDNILPKSLKPLNEIVDVLRQYPNTTLIIEGHTDSKLSAAHNMDLSKRRSNSVKTFFVNKGLNASRFQTRGYGPERPVADNNTVEGRALNRRVEMKAIFIY
jgi:outer membrane protein OmpA-like peptidoglycan-associated protein